MEMPVGHDESTGGCGIAPQSHHHQQLKLRAISGVACGGGSPRHAGTAHTEVTFSSWCDELLFP